MKHEEFLHNIANGGPLLCHPVVMYRRDIVLAQGGYHAAFKHCEDLDLWLRLASATQMANIPERLIKYRHYLGQVSKRHATEQQVGAAIAYEAWRMRDAGKPDPTADLDKLPPSEELDAFFGEPGLAARVRAAVTNGILHSPIALRDNGFDIIVHHIGEGGSHKGMWRTVARLLKLGEPARAAPVCRAGPQLMAAPSPATPQVTVALVVYNNAPYVGEAIDSILGQTFTDFEFLIVNDGSTDGSGHVIDARAASDPRIRVIHQQNRGLIASLNLLFAEAAAPWVARTDGDDISLPDRLGKQLADIKADPRIGAAAGDRGVDLAGNGCRQPRCLWRGVALYRCALPAAHGGLFHSSAGGQLAAIGAGIGRGGSAHRAILHFLGTAG